MNRIPDQPPAQQPSLDGLRAACPEWEIRYEAALHVWTADRHDGGAMTREQVIAAYKFAGVSDPERLADAFLAASAEGET